MNMNHIEKWLKSAWEFFRANTLNLVAMYAVYLLIAVVTQKLPLLPLIVMPGLFGSVVIITLRKMRGTEIDLKNMTLGYDYFLPLVFSSVLVGVMVLAGFIFLIIPGLFIAALYVFTVPLIVDQEMDFWPAMEASRKKVMESPIEYLVFSTMLIALIFLGALLFGVGLLVTMPIAVSALIFAYVEVFKSDEASPHTTLSQ